MNKFIKKVSLLFIFLTFSYSLFAYGGIMTGMHNLKIVSTTHFDIIYPPESEKTAALIAQRVDGMYESICNDLHEEPWLRMPISVSPIRDELNANFSPAYYNMIELYDTVPDEQLAVNTENILQVLYHELVHAVTMNMKNNVLKKYAKLFGDFYSYLYLSTPCSVLEGTAVAFESKDGEGRLNDPFSTEIVKQAKIEGKFPFYNETYMARDIYPRGAVPYVIGGSFMSWLYNTYGSEKFTSFWRTLVCLTDDYQETEKQLKNELHNEPFFEAIFKKVYGISVNDSWKKFYESIAVPDIAADPIASGEAKDFFVESAESNPSNKRISTRQLRTRNKAQEAWNNKGSRYISVTSCKNGVAWIDASCNTVWYAELKGTFWQKPRKLFCLTDISRISFSSDGLFLAVSCSRNIATIKFRAGVYSMKNKRLVFAPQTGLRDATVITNTDGSHTLAAVHTQSQFANLLFYPLKEKKAKCNGFKEPLTFSQSETNTSQNRTTTPTWNRVPFSVCDAGDGRAAYISKDGMYWNVQIFDSTTGATTGYTPQNNTYILQNLAPGAEKNTFLFSWGERGADKDMLPRLGILDIRGTEPVWIFQNTDISGGVHYPATLPMAINSNFDNHTLLPSIVYSAQFYTNTKLFILTLQEEKCTTIKIQTPDNSLPAVDTVTDKGIQNARSYHAYPFYKKGIFIPAGIVPISNDNLDISCFSFLGATWYTSNPWRDNVLLASVSIDPLTLTGGVYANLVGGTDGALFSYNLSGTAVFDSYGFCQTYDAISLTSSVPVGTVSQIVLSANSDFFSGTSRSLEDELKYTKWFTSPEHTEQALTSKSNGSIQFTTVHKTGPGRFEKGGVFASAEYSLNYTDATLYHNLGATIGFQAPQLIPETNPYGITLNIPFTAQTQLFNDTGSFEKHTVTAVLFSAEIQQPISILHLYCNRFTVEAAYTGSLKYDNPQSWDFLRTTDLIAAYTDFHYYDTASLTVHTYLSVNEGEVARFPFDISSSFYYRIRPEEDEQTWGFGMFGKILF